MSIGTNWARHHTYQATRLHRPTRLDELQEVVASADRIRTLGSRHSFSDIADSHELITLDDMPALIEIDEDSETVTVAGQVNYGTLGQHLEAAGWALRNLASLPHISVAGSVATGTHGSGDRNGTLARAVAGLEIVTASGEVENIGPADDRFDGAVVSLGTLGVVSSVTLDIEPTFDVRQDVFSGLPFDTMLENLDSITSRAYSVSIFTRWDDETTVWLKTRMDERAAPQALYGVAPTHAGLHPIVDMPASNSTQQGGIPGPWIDRLPHFKLGFTPSNGEELQTEYLVPRQHARAAIEAVRGLGDRIRPHLLVTELRTMAADSLWLSGAYDTDAIGIHFTWNFHQEEVLALLPVIEETLAPFSVRPHWGKLFHGVAEGAYPKLAEFVALAEQLDPSGKFRNDFVDRHVFDSR